MAILKCKMCGGELSFEAGATVCECEYCGSKQTLPIVDDEKKAKLFERANRLRFNCEFDKAASVYESIVADFPTEAEAYWGSILCKYGIEYVDDPATGEKVPTCHRSSFDSLMEDHDFDMVLENADAIAKRVYREQAKQIEEIRKGIIEVSGKEQPYDIFICYKETAPDGQRTIDSVIAQDVYEALTDKGYRVFFSRITLEDKLGTEYEPYIFAALNSAKLMLVFGTDYDYFDAVWVRNEWSRFLKLMAKDKTKHLIPCYKNVDAYDIPKEFARLQAQDMGKVGAMQDLLRGIDKIMAVSKPAMQKQENAQQDVATTQMFRRFYALLAEEDWAKADEQCERILDKDFECSEAYIGKLLVEKHLHGVDELSLQEETFEDNWNYQKAIKYANPTQKTEYESYNVAIRVRKEQERLLALYNAAKQKMDSAMTEQDFLAVAELYSAINGFDDSDSLRLACLKKAEIISKDKAYSEAVRLMEMDSVESQQQAIAIFEKLQGYRDSEARIALCNENVEKIRAAEEERRLRAIYDAASSYMHKETVRDQERAITEFEKIAGYADVNEKLEQCRRNLSILKEKAEQDRLDDVYERALAMMKKKTVNGCEKAKAQFQLISGWKDSEEKVVECDAILAELRKGKGKTANVKVGVSIAAAALLLAGAGGYYAALPTIQYNRASTYLERGEYDAAIAQFTAAASRKDVTEEIANCWYQKGNVLLAAGSYGEARNAFAASGHYQDAPDKMQLALAEQLFTEGDYLSALEAYQQLANTGYNLDTVLGRAHDLTVMGNFEAALLFYDSMLSFGETKESVYADALYLQETGAYEAALLYYETSGLIAMEDEALYPCYYNFGLSLIKSGDFEKAKTAFIMSRTYENSSEYLYYVSGKSEYENNHFKVAISCFEKCKNILDSVEMLEQSRLNLAEERYLLGRYESAFLAYQQCSDSEIIQQKLIMCNEAFLSEDTHILEDTGVRYRYDKNKNTVIFYRDTSSEVGNFVEFTIYLDEQFWAEKRKRIDLTTSSLAIEIPCKKLSNSKTIYFSFYRKGFNNVFYGFSSPKVKTEVIRTTDLFGNPL